MYLRMPLAPFVGRCYVIALDYGQSAPMNSPDRTNAKGCSTLITVAVNGLTFCFACCKRHGFVVVVAAVVVVVVVVSVAVIGPAPIALPVVVTLLSQ